MTAAKFPRADDVHAWLTLIAAKLESLPTHRDLNAMEQRLKNELREEIQASADRVRVDLREEIQASQAATVQQLGAYIAQLEQMLNDRLPAKA